MPVITPLKLPTSENSATCTSSDPIPTGAAPFSIQGARPARTLAGSDGSDPTDRPLPAAGSGDGDYTFLVSTMVNDHCDGKNMVETVVETVVESWLIVLSTWLIVVDDAK